jgi:hypothetical protein
MERNAFPRNRVLLICSNAGSVTYVDSFPLLLEEDREVFADL